MTTQTLEKLPDNAILVGRGDLNWNRNERVSDRYGSVMLLQLGTTKRAKLNLNSVAKVDRCRLLARVVATKESTHIGDFARGLAPRTPQVGDIIVLGEGEMYFVFEGNSNLVSVGVIPGDGRTSDWMNPRALYDVHEQTVELYCEAIE